jgi:dynein light intermediate chain 1
VSSSRSTPSKQILLLGQPSSGKSTLVAGLLQKDVSDDSKDDHHRTDFAVGYDYADVRDEADEGALACLATARVRGVD